ncbi:DUF3800 domain-containing protein [Rhizobium sp. AC27/96]|uniref:DUF3800 domain-containing protein n=1 Tax=Rhizobium sp. AC27/96 TaxID=1841653 RepID=UPI0009F3DDB1|nr:DUF3800 domain-containing protein [Rhizobium sp. AC27/96]
MSRENIPDYQYIAFIDEAGDPGLTRVRPIDPIGSTEWMTISAVLVDKENAGEVTKWVAEILRSIGPLQRHDLHFRNLSPTRKAAVCRYLADLPVRLFVVASNKKNMRGHRNINAEKMPSQQWFYNWMVRILIERVTHYCEMRSIRNYGVPKKVKFEFSERGGHSYSQTAAYHELLRFQARNENIILKKWVPRWSVMDWRLVEAHPHKSRAGLQLSDVVASAFYTAVDNLDTGQCDGTYAELLRPRIAFREDHNYSDYGVVLQPTPAWKANLAEDQKSIFRFYGYNF